ncbi:hypothetical protein AAFF_G00201790 [Aldrovandia affinis]|uniref:Uncharacterized protein n=1 Tax=Aldrovandia affinis TaxID=143900 RepID=A0AAD7SWY2_9TELE|nr:hypothetical protein AAFF_G00201790 [Aldrovandia affinis]
MFAVLITRCTSSKMSVQPHEISCFARGGRLPATADTSHQQGFASRESEDDAPEQRSAGDGHRAEEKERHVSPRAPSKIASGGWRCQAAGRQRWSDHPPLSYGIPDRGGISPPCPRSPHSCGPHRETGRRAPGISHTPATPSHGLCYSQSVTFTPRSIPPGIPHSAFTRGSRPASETVVSKSFVFGLGESRENVAPFRDFVRSPVRLLNLFLCKA